MEIITSNKPALEINDEAQTAMALCNVIDIHNKNEKEQKLDIKIIKQIETSNVEKHDVELQVKEITNIPIEIEAGHKGSNLNAGGGDSTETRLQDFQSDGLEPWCEEQQNTETKHESQQVETTGMRLEVMKCHLKDKCIGIDNVAETEAQEQDITGIDSHIPHMTLKTKTESDISDEITVLDDSSSALDGMSMVVGG